MSLCHSSRFHGVRCTHVRLSDVGVTPRFERQPVCIRVRDLTKVKCRSRLGAHQPPHLPELPNLSPAGISPEKLTTVQKTWLPRTDSLKTSSPAAYLGTCTYLLPAQQYARGISRRTVVPQPSFHVFLEPGTQKRPWFSDILVVADDALFRVLVFSPLGKMTLTVTRQRPVCIRHFAALKCFESVLTRK